MSEAKAITVTEVVGGTTSATAAIGWDHVAAQRLAQGVNVKRYAFKAHADYAARQIDESNGFFAGATGDTARQRGRDDHEDSTRSAAIIEDMAAAIEKFCRAVSDETGLIRGRIREAELSPYQLYVTDSGAVKSRMSQQEFMRRFNEIGHGFHHTAMWSQRGDLSESIRNALARLSEADINCGREIRKQLEKLTARTKEGSVPSSTGKDKPGKPSLSHILQNYQTDPGRGEVLWPAGAALWLIQKYDSEFRPQRMTREEIALLEPMVATDPAGLARCYKIKTEASEVAAQAFREQGQNDGKQDAFRHAYWNARMAQRLGPEFTAKLTTAHEKTFGNGAHREAMDLYNNEVGRKIGAAHPNASPTEIAELIKQAVDSGDTVVINPQGHIEWSDQVPLRTPMDKNHQRVEPGWNDPPAIGIPLPGRR